MIAKINLDGKDRMAIVFDECYTLDELAEIRNSLTNLLGCFDGIYDECGYQSERAYAHYLLDALSPNTDQAFEMMSHYFGSTHKPKTAEKKLCEVYI